MDNKGSMLVFVLVAVTVYYIQFIRHTLYIYDFIQFLQPMLGDRLLLVPSQLRKLLTSSILSLTGKWQSQDLNPQFDWKDLDLPSFSFLSFSSLLLNFIIENIRYTQK